MNLNTELVKHCASLCRLPYLDGLMTRMTSEDTEVWALRAENFPEKLVPRNSRNYMCYMGVSTKKLNASYGKVHFLTFGHENFIEDSSVSSEGILEHMYDIYCEQMKDQEDVDELYLYPCQIDDDSLVYWSDIARDTWNIRDKRELNEFIRQNELMGWVDWSALEEDLPDIYHPSEYEYITDSESESESDSESCTEEGEIKNCESSDETPRKRRKFVFDETDDET